MSRLLNEAPELEVVDEYDGRLGGEGFGHLDA